MVARPKILFVVTSHDTLGDTGRKTGWYLVYSLPSLWSQIILTATQPEGAHPYQVLAPHADIVWASPKGGVSPLDPLSNEVSEDDAMTQEFLKHKSKWEHTEKLASFLGRAHEFEAIFYVGGWGRKA